MIRGPAVADLDAIFTSDWNFATDDSLVSAMPTTPEPGADSVAQVTASGPDTAEDSIYDALLAAVTPLL